MVEAGMEFWGGEEGGTASPLPWTSWGCAEALWKLAAQRFSYILSASPATLSNNFITHVVKPESGGIYMWVIDRCPYIPGLRRLSKQPCS